MRVLYISEIYPDVKRGLGVWGGGERQFYEISKRVANRGHEVMVVTCRFPGQPATEVIDGIRIFRNGLSRNPVTGGARKGFLPIFSYIWRTASKAMKLAPDVIHCNTYFPVYSGGVARRLKGTPLVSTFHDIYGLKGWISSQRSCVWGLLGHFTTTLAAKLPCDRIIAVSPQCKQKLLTLGVPAERITVIPNGVDLRRFDSVCVEKVPNHVLYVGRLVNFKHVDWLIQAFVEVLEEVPDAKLKIVGAGPEWAVLYGLVKSLGLESHVVFTGKTNTYEAVARYFKESEVFVLPSTVEGESIVLKEAMAAGLPVIAMNVQGSGVLSLVRDGENGFLIEPEKPDLMAEKIVELLKDAKRRKKMGEAGRSFVGQYDWDVIAARTIRVYKEVMV
jgi:glycosyltransferase involved in cell wall biosynthesis